LRELLQPKKTDSYVFLHFRKERHLKRVIKVSSFLFLLLCLLVLSSVFSGQALSLAGHWEGAIEIPGMKLDVDIDFSQKADGSWKGDISIPVQKAKNLPLSNISLEGLQVTFSISGVPGKRGKG